MGAIGAVFQPELIELMKAVLDDATATLPEAKRTSTMKAEIASHILARAAKGERDPTALKSAALLAVVECSHYSHDISPERAVQSERAEPPAVAAPPAVPVGRLHCGSVWCGQIARASAGRATRNERGRQLRRPYSSLEFC